MSYVIKNQTSLANRHSIYNNNDCRILYTYNDDFLGFFGHNHDHFNHFDDKSSNNHQRTESMSNQRQHSFCLTAGFGSPVSASCNNTAASTNANAGSNGAASDSNGNSRTHQNIDQSGHQHHRAFCITAGADSPIVGSVIIVPSIQTPMQVVRVRDERLIIKENNSNNQNIKSIGS